MEKLFPSFGGGCGERLIGGLRVEMRGEVVKPPGGYS